VRRRDLLLAPVCEVGLLLVVAVAGVVTRQPLIFASLGPTAYERPYNILMGHLVAVLAGFAALHLTHAWSVPGVTLGVTWPRAWAAILSAGLTVFGTLLLRASQPAAVSTTLLISLGVMQTRMDGVVIMGAVVLMTLVGEPLRRWREWGAERAESGG
jgi:hypothetical protein